jgi:glutamine synthetase
MTTTYDPPIAVAAPLSAGWESARLRQAVATGQLRAVMLAVPTMRGELKGKTLDADFAADQLLGGRDDEMAIADGHVAMCAYLLTTLPDMNPLDGFALASSSTGWQDMVVRPEFTRAWTVPWRERTVLLIGDALDDDGAPIEVAPRQVLRRQVERLAGLGLRARAGLEYEASAYQGTYAFYAGAGEDRSRRRLGYRNGDYDLSPAPELDELLTALHIGLRRAGLPVEAIKPEAGLGQIEITLRHADPLTAADELALCKWAAKGIAARNGRSLTFMAAPEPGEAVGNGGHVHLSLWHDDDGNALAAPGGELSPLGSRVIAGILATVGRFAPLWAPTVNSYRRFSPHGEPFAPRRADYGFAGRNSAVRVIDHGEHTRVEVRVPGADANPYLALAAVLAGACHGVDRGLTPGRPLAPDAPYLPASLPEALSAFEDASPAVDAFGKEVVEHYGAAARAELRAHAGANSDVEVRLGFEHA